MFREKIFRIIISKLEIKSPLRGDARNRVYNFQWDVFFYCNFG